MSKQHKLNIKQWAPDDRPREKMLAKGQQALSDAELLAILVGSGNTEETAVELCKRIMAACDNDLNLLAKKSVKELTSHFKGIGTAKAVTIVAALELGKRRKERYSTTPPVMKSSESAYQVFAPLLMDLPHEEVWIALTNNANRLITTQRIGQGGLSASMADIRIMLKAAIENNATGILLAHNHPSGHLKPSQQDRQLTDKLQHACTLMDIRLHDHLIIGNMHGEMFSFADEGLLN